jgi:GT2 family glycosyltransferase
MLDGPETLGVEKIEPRPVINEISVVIPTLGRTILKKSLYYIATGSAWPANLIVVDQGSEPQVAARIEVLNSIGIAAEYVSSAQRGRAAGINRGLERVQTRFVAITDDDCFVDTDWLKRMAACLNDDPEAIVTGQVEPAGEGVIMAVTSRTPAIYRRPRLTFDSLSGGNMGTSISVINRVGRFDEDARLRTAEDGEWAYRALRSGVPIIYAPQVIVRHFGWRDGQNRANQYRKYARSHGGFYGKYLRKGDWFIGLRTLIHHLRALKRWLRGVVTRDPELALNGWCYLTGLLPGVISGMRRNRTARPRACEFLE